MTLEARGSTRRTVLKTGVAGLAAAVAGGSSVLVSVRRAAAEVVEADLFVHRGERTMVDGVVVPFVGFGSTPDRLELPSGTLEVQSGDTVHVTVRNLIDLPVGFAVPGLPGVQGRPVDPGTTGTTTFTAPAQPGTRFYAGTVVGSADTGRALGATGALLVLPRGDRTSVDASFPGVRDRGRRQPQFGTRAAVGIPATWVQERTWLFSEHNPTTARDLAGGRVALPDDPEPEYFLVNGTSGVLSVEDPHTYHSGRAGGLGRPGDSTLLRLVNTGRAPRSIHHHGNHFWVLSHPTPWLVGAFKDTVTVPPGRAVDVLVPLETPPDSFPVTSRAQKYVVHDHIEMAETASGGHYPAGMISAMVLE